jgi:hypothetical protein
VFGVFDGSTSAAGVLFTSLKMASHAVLVVCLGLAVAGGVGMAAGSWLSKENGAGPGRSVAIGGATTVGTLAPALPYLWASGHSALIGSGFILVLIGALITGVRSRNDSLVRSAVETYGVLVAVCAAVGLCTVATGGVG